MSRPLPDAPYCRQPGDDLVRNLTGSALDDEDAHPGLTGRWRATLAHEAGHILFHRALLELDDGQSTLFDSSDAGPRSERILMRCLKRDVGHVTRTRDWKEVQANRAMAALLMRARTFKKVTRHEAVTLGLATVEAESAPARQLAGRLAAQFGVSRQAASIRLETLGLVQAPGTRQLPPLAS